MKLIDGRIPCFKAYDVRGRVPDELDQALARDIGLAFAGVVKPTRVVVGHDIRLSCPDISSALIEGLTEAGVDVVTIGQCGTEEVYFATFHLGLDGGIMVTASHNPVDYNGMKFVRDQARPISSDTGLRDIEKMVIDKKLEKSNQKGTVKAVEVRGAYLDHIMTHVEVDKLKPLKIVVNPGNGCAGPVLEQLAHRLPFELIKVHFEPDGSFPHGVPNPLLPENRAATGNVVRESGADLGIAWDGDFDRCFMFDEQGTFIEGYYIVGLLSEQILRRHKGGKVVHDPRLIWNTLEMVEGSGGTAVQCKSGHAFIKERMRAEDAVYGGEMSAHHYFREFSYCDSGMIPWLLVAQAMATTGQPLSKLVGDRIARFPTSGEINLKVKDAKAALAAVEAQYTGGAKAVDKVDGIGLEFEKWRFNLRMSNTEPVVRLNVESRADKELMQKKTNEILELLEGLAG